MANSHIPLAERMRPNSLDEFIGQEHLVGKGKALEQMIKSGKAHSILFWGPPGVGKTTLAQIIAHSLNIQFFTLSAIDSGVKDVRTVIDMARKSGHALLFIDEIHRFNKAQQDSLLGAVEKGIITLIGATTENPSFEVISALLSRCQVFILHANATEEQKTRAMEIGAQERDNIVQKELKKEQKAWVDNNKEILNGVDSFYNNLAKTLEAGHVTWNAVWQDMKKVAIDMLVKEGEQLLQQTIINAAVSETSLAASVAATDTAMAAIAAAAAPAAALVSIASWGGADAAALAALTATMAATQAMAVVPKFAKGGNFTVPPGYSNDSYPMLVSSGEKVNVTPANQSGGGATVHVHINAPGTTVEMVRQAVIEGLRQTGMKVDKYLVDNRRNIILGSV